MNFGDILDQWNRRQNLANAKNRRKGPDSGTGGLQPAAGETPGQPEPERADPLSVWLRINGVYDKDADKPEDAGTAESAQERRRRLLTKRADAVLDLHGLTRDEAWSSLEDFFNAGKRQGFEKLLIIHGKGNHSPGEAILSRTVREFIERCPFAGESGHGSAVSGGSGTTWVLLKDKPFSAPGI
ncbi:MAG: Smr/MutS family protein [Treponema sp.]|nr:Smr/MutS family protein [Treponema sp.]